MSSKNYYPVMLDCSGRSCLVIGGGAIAERRVQALLEAGAIVTLISPEVTMELSCIIQSGKITWLQRSYKKGDVAGAFLIYAATSDQKLNKEIAEEAAEMGILVNVASRGEMGSFIQPSAFRRGHLVISVTTGGASPGLAAEICAQLEEMYGEEYEQYLDFLYEMRRQIKLHVKTPALRVKLIKRLSEMGILEEIRQGTYQAWSAEQITNWIAHNQEEYS